MFHSYRGLAANDYTRKYLDSFFISLHDPRMNADGVAYFKDVGVAFLLFFFDSTDDLVHKNSSQSRTQSFQQRGQNCN